MESLQRIEIAKLYQLLYQPRCPAAMSPWAGNGDPLKGAEPSVRCTAGIRQSSVACRDSPFQKEPFYHKPPLQKGVGVAAAKPLTGDCSYQRDPSRTVGNEHSAKGGFLS